MAPLQDLPPFPMHRGMIPQRAGKSRGKAMGYLPVPLPVARMQYRENITTNDAANTV
jgi:hypothetical protein